MEKSNAGLALYHAWVSSASRRVRFVLEEKRLPYQSIPMDLLAFEQHTPEYLELNPNGWVPTLVHDGSPVIESSVICEYLDDRYPEVGMRPDDAWQVSRMRFWMKHIDIKLHPSCGALQWPLVMADKLRAMSAEQQTQMIERVIEKPRRERQRRLLKQGYDAPDVADAVAVYERTIADMDALLENQAWLAGDTFSLADCAMAPYFQTLFQFGWHDWYGQRKNVADWYQRIRSRACYQQGVSADFDSATLDDLNQRGKPAWNKIQDYLKAAA